MRRCRNRLAFLILLMPGLLLSAVPPALAQTPVFHRREIKVPDIPGYLTLKCDLHMHTVFSDGRVWPTVRVDEAWSEGLDAISITDHLEYLPHKKDVSENFNRPYEIALPRAGELSLLLIKGVEVTKDMPTGHYNALFIDDAEKLNHQDYLKALRAADEQGAFIFWNHPGWKNSDEQGRAIWHGEQTAVYDSGLMHGIEVVNGRDYYPNGHRWAIEKKLTLLGTTDVHSPMAFDYRPGEIRPLTLVFATERSPAAIREALFDRRTAVLSEGSLYGERRFLEPLFAAAVEILNPRVELKGRGGWAWLQVRNSSDIPFTLTADGKAEGVEFLQRLTLVPEATVLLRVSAAGNSLEVGTRAV
ncbi:MAG: histidinol-phosphatase, partial [Candidatus Glassbacteria bacterium]|nr:histidinol-phosphatase [Candidatus Glassbacteria bacterium]